MYKHMSDTFKKQHENNEIAEALNLEGDILSKYVTAGPSDFKNQDLKDHFTEKKENQDIAELLKEYYDKNRTDKMVLNTVEEQELSNHRDFVNKNMHIMVEQFLLVNSPIMKQIYELRKQELFEIYHFSDEFKYFQKTLPDDQHITVDGYLIYRTKKAIVKEGLPGFANETTYEYKYDNPAEDITFLFGSHEYCNKINKLRKQLLTWPEFCEKYYGSKCK